MKTKGATRRQVKAERNISAAILPWLKRISVGVFAITTMVAAVFLGLHWVNKEVTHLRVKAPLVHVSEQEIKAQLKSHFPASFFYLNVDTVRTQLLAMPMVRDATVKKNWPDELYIAIQEEVPVARWNNKSMLSHDGEILPMDVQQLSQVLLLPSLEGHPSKRQIVMRHFHLFTQWGKAYSLNWVGIQQSLAGWKLTEKSGLQIWLDAENAMADLKRLGGAVKKLKLEDIERIDLRYEQGFAVAWRPAMEQANKKENKA